MDLAQSVKCRPGLHNKSLDSQRYTEKTYLKTIKTNRKKDRVADCNKKARPEDESLGKILCRHENLSS